jgi:hypothetical protein
MADILTQRLGQAKGLWRLAGWWWRKQDPYRTGPERFA